MKALIIMSILMTSVCSFAADSNLYTCLGSTESGRKVFIDIPGVNQEMAELAIKNVNRTENYQSISCHLSTYQDTVNYAGCMAALYMTGVGITICSQKFSGSDEEVGTAGTIDSES